IHTQTSLQLPEAAIICAPTHSEDNDMTEQFAAQTDNTQGKTHQSDIQNDVSNALLNELRDMDNNSNTFKNFAPEQSSKLEMESQMQDHAQKGSAGTSEKLEGANNQRNELSDKISDTAL